jgi:hypothetical protein
LTNAVTMANKPSYTNQYVACRAMCGLKQRVKIFIYSMIFFRFFDNFCRAIKCFDSISSEFLFNQFIGSKSCAVVRISIRA